MTHDDPLLIQAINHLLDQQVHQQAQREALVTKALPVEDLRILKEVIEDLGRERAHVREHKLAV